VLHARFLIITKISPEIVVLSLVVVGGRDARFAFPAGRRSGRDQRGARVGRMPAGVGDAPARPVALRFRARLVYRTFFSLFPDGDDDPPLLLTLVVVVVRPNRRGSMAALSLSRPPAMEFLPANSPPFCRVVCARFRVHFAFVPPSGS